MTGPLAGVRVVVLAGMGPVPFASMLLADMGAHVVRVIRPASRPSRALSQVDGLREEHDLVNRGVDSVAVDLKDPQGTELVLRLAGEADVFIEGYRPGVAERLGLGPDVVLRRNPALVYARLTGYGQAGPLAREAGHDINYVAQSGALHAMARDGEAPRPPVNLLGDYAGGGMMAAFGIACALLEARASGCGQVIDAAMVDGVALLTAKLQGLRAAGLFSDRARHQLDRFRGPVLRHLPVRGRAVSRGRCAGTGLLPRVHLAPRRGRRRAGRTRTTGPPGHGCASSSPRRSPRVRRPNGPASTRAPTRASRRSSPSTRPPGTRTTPSAASSSASAASFTRPRHRGSAAPRPGRPAAPQSGPVDVRRLLESWCADRDHSSGGSSWLSST